jgi:ketosteroid isomerase-like protein
VIRRAIALSAVVVASLALAACGDDSGGGSSDSSGTTRGTGASSNDVAAARDISDEALISEFFDLLVAQDVEGLDEYLSPAFQLQRADGTHLDKEGYLEAPAQIEGYDLVDIEGTRDGDVRVIRSSFIAEGELDGEAIVEEPAPRLSTFVWNGERWQLAAHANFTSLEAADDPSVIDVPDAPEANVDPSALETVTPFFELLRAGDTDGLAELLSDAWIIQRSDGNHLGKDEYLANQPIVEGYEFYDVEMTEAGDLRVVRSLVSVDAQVDGETITPAPSPYLSTFVRDGDAWRMISHANLTPLAG